MKLSIVVSCYKQEKYIGECLDSILAQQTDFDFEIIVADDFSPDKTPDIIRQYEARFPGRFRLLFQEENVGANKNYIAVHNAANGEYVAHIDGDDVMLPGKLQAQVDVLDKYPSCNLVFHRSRYFNDDGTYEADTGSLFEDGKTVFFGLSELARWGTIATHSSYVYRRCSRRTRVYSKDFMEWFFAYESLMCGGSGAYINSIFLKYRCNLKGDTYLSSLAGREKAYRIIISNVIDYYHLGGPKSDLYGHLLINVIMYIKSTRRIRWFMVKFLIVNVLQFRPWKLLDTVHIRKMVRPGTKIR